MSRVRKLPTINEDDEPVPFSEEAFERALQELVRMGRIRIVRDPGGDKYKDLIIEVREEAEDADANRE